MNCIVPYIITQLPKNARGFCGDKKLVKKYKKSKEKPYRKEKSLGRFLVTAIWNRCCWYLNQPASSGRKNTMRGVGRDGTATTLFEPDKQAT